MSYFKIPEQNTSPWLARIAWKMFILFNKIILSVHIWLLFCLLSGKQLEKKLQNTKWFWICFPWSLYSTDFRGRRLFLKGFTGKKIINLPWMADSWHLELCTYSLVFEKCSRTNKLVFQYLICNPDNKSNILWAGLWDNFKHIWWCRRCQHLL